MLINDHKAHKRSLALKVLMTDTHFCGCGYIKKRCGYIGFDDMRCGYIKKRCGYIYTYPHLF